MSEEKLEKIKTAEEELNILQKDYAQQKMELKTFRKQITLKKRAIDKAKRILQNTESKIEAALSGKSLYKERKNKEKR